MGHKRRIDVEYSTVFTIKGLEIIMWPLLPGLNRLSEIRRLPGVHAIPTANALHLIDYETMDTYNDEGNETEARLGWMFRGNYDYANKYQVEFSARYDGSWKFPPDHRWGFFPSASVGWRISEENFGRNQAIEYFQRFENPWIIRYGG